MIKLTILLKRHQHLSHEDFLWSYKHEHAMQFSALSVVKKSVISYDQYHSLPIAMPGIPVPFYDAIAELWFENAAAMFSVFTSSEYLEKVRPAEKILLDMNNCAVLISVHHKIF